MLTDHVRQRIHAEIELVIARHPDIIVHQLLGPPGRMLKAAIRQMSSMTTVFLFMVRSPLLFFALGLLPVFTVFQMIIHDAHCLKK